MIQNRIPLGKSVLTGAASGPGPRLCATAERREAWLHRVTSWFAWRFQVPAEPVPGSMDGRADGRGRTVKPDRALLSGTPADSVEVRHGKQSRTGETIAGGAMKWTTILCTMGVSGLLGISAADKVIHWGVFVFTLQQNPLLPMPLAASIGGAVLAVECFLTVVLLLPRTRHTGFFVAALVFTVFTIVIAILMIVTPGERCGCTFLFDYDRADFRHLTMNVLLALLSAYLWYVESNGSSAGAIRPV